MTRPISSSAGTGSHFWGQESPTAGEEKKEFEELRRKNKEEGHRYFYEGPVSYERSLLS
jgi:hypothetical protein